MRINIGSYNSILLIVILLLLAACGNSANDRLEKAYQKTLKKNPGDTSGGKEKEEPLLVTPITERNVREVLTRYGKENPENQVIIHTRLGDIKIRLFEETPLHRANFIRLAKNKFYDQGEFNRVIKEFMIQGGDSTTGK